MRLTTAVLALIGVLSPLSAGASVNYGYDPAGRLVTALYDNGLCVIYAYDPGGNRTSQSGTISGTPQQPIWGTGVWGCFVWTPH